MDERDRSLFLYSVRVGAGSNGSGTRYDHYDGRGDVGTQTTGAGTVSYQASYEAWGTRTAEFGVDPDRQRANTKEEDPTGLLCEGMRYRDLETGVFITPDPLGMVDGPNLYAYVNDNPWTKFDPEGLAGEENDNTWGAQYNNRINTDPDSPQIVSGRNNLGPVAEGLGLGASAMMMAIPGPKVVGGVGAAEEVAPSLVESAGRAPGIFRRTLNAIKGWFGGGAATSQDSAVTAALRNADTAPTESASTNWQKAQATANDVMAAAKAESGGLDALGQANTSNAAADLPQMKGMGAAERGGTLTDAGFARTKVSNSAARNETWSHADGSEVRVHPYGNEKAIPYKSGNNAHLHKQDPAGNQLNDRGLISTDPNATHIGVPNPSDFPKVRNRPNGS